jgi:hypothetical protein
VVFWEDHSVALKEFAARLIFSCGSMESFLCRPVGNSGKDNTREFQAVLSRAKPGYFLLIAQKL